jgi:hypothetical protein
MRDHNSVSLICAAVSALQPVSCKLGICRRNSNEISFLQRGTKTKIPVILLRKSPVGELNVSQPSIFDYIHVRPLMKRSTMDIFSPDG